MAGMTINGKQYVYGPGGKLVPADGGSTAAPAPIPEVKAPSGEQVKDSYSKAELADMKARPGAYTANELASGKEYETNANKSVLEKLGLEKTPDYKSILDAKGNVAKPYSITDKLKKVDTVQSIVPQLDERLKNINVDTTGYDALKKEATRTGPSAWMQNELARNEAQTNYQLGDIGAANAKAAADARANLASRGGLSSGASERLAGSAGKNTIAEQQNLRRNTNLGNMALSSQDEINRLGTLSQLPGAAQGIAQFNLTKSGIPINALSTEQGYKQQNNTYDVGAHNTGVAADTGHAISDVAAQNPWNLAAQQGDNAALAAGYTADATGGGGGGKSAGGWFNNLLDNPIFNFSNPLTPQVSAIKNLFGGGGGSSFGGINTPWKGF